ncbi:unnamed protein product, partial [Prorocentrum cordatum]
AAGGGPRSFRAPPLCRAGPRRPRPAPARARPGSGGASMARVGVANYSHSSDHAVKQDRYWRETLERGQRDHPFSTFNMPAPRPSYANLNTTSNDFYGRTLYAKDHMRRVAAGKSSFHHNVAKPPGLVHANVTTGSFERRRPPPTPGGRSAASSAARGMLQGSASAPALY